MAELNFPNPAVQPVYKAGGITWTWNSALQVWSSDIGDTATAKVNVGPSEPFPADTGDMWYSTVSGRLYIYNNGNWVDASPVDSNTISPDEVANNYLSKTKNDTTIGKLTAQGGFVGNLQGNVTGSVTGNVTGNLDGIAEKLRIATTFSSSTRKIAGFANSAGGSSAFEYPAANPPTINSAGLIQANGGFKGSLDGNATTATTAATATNATNAMTATNCSRSVTGSNGLTGGGVLNANRTISGVDATTSTKGVVQLNDAINSTSTTRAATSKAVKTAYDRVASYAPSKTGSGASGTWGINISGTSGSTNSISNSNVRAAIKTTSHNTTGSYALLASNDNSDKDPGSTKGSSGLRWADADGGTTNKTISGSWRLMGRTAGQSSDWTVKQTSVWLRYA